jgi:hypothetical protein
MGQTPHGAWSGNHPLPRWRVADEAARLALTVGAADLDGLCRVISPPNVYWLVSHSPAVWRLVGDVRAPDVLALVPPYSWETDEIFIGRPEVNVNLTPQGPGVFYLAAGTASFSVLANDGGGALSARPRYPRQTTSVAGAMGEIYSNRFLWGVTGFRFVKDFGFNPITDWRMFAGLNDGTAFATNVAIDTQINCIGVGRIDGLTNMHLVHNDATGLCTTIDLGANLPAVGLANHLYRLTLEMAPAAASCTYLVERLSAGHAAMYKASGTISTNLPGQYVTLCDRLWCSNNTQAAACSVLFARMTAVMRPAY